MKKLFRKIGAMLMAVIMVLGVCATVFAADGDTSVTPTTAPTTSSDHATIIGIEDVTDETITVMAYKIAKYNSDTGLYEQVLPNSIADVKSIKSAELIALADKDKKTELAAKNKPITIERKEGANYVVNNPDDGITSGIWMILVEGSTKNLYNPAILTVMQGGSEDEYNYGTLNYNDYTWDSEVYVKKAEPRITKTATVVKSDANNTDEKGVQVGDILEFTVTGDIPNYTENNKNIGYKISDTLTGLTLITSEDGKDYTPVATVGAESDSDLTNEVIKAIVAGKTGFTVDLSGNSKKENQEDSETGDNGWDSWLQANGGKQIVITYYAKVSSAAKINVEKKTNTAKLEYTTNSGNLQSKEDKTIHYTFGIDTGFNGESTETSTEKTGEFIKTDGGTVEYVEGDEKPIVSIKGGNPLSGAEFKLYIKIDDTGEKDIQFTYGSSEDDHHYTTDSNGRLEINGLDSDVDYYLIETKAPTGYSRISTKIPVKIHAEYDKDNTTTTKLVGYTVYIGNKKTSYKCTDNGIVKTIINTKDTPNNPYGFENKRIGTLPSTGGTGTYLFTIIGVMVMAAVAGMFFVSRARDKETDK